MTAGTPRSGSASAPLPGPGGWPEMGPSGEPLRGPAGGLAGGLAGAASSRAVLGNLTTIELVFCVRKNCKVQQRVHIFVRKLSAPL